jgi:hypothetical protein
MSFSGDAGAKPPRVFFVNLRTGEGQEMPFMPTEFTEEIVVNYGRQVVAGMSHETLQFSNTSNYKISGLEFFFLGVPRSGSEDPNNLSQQDIIHDKRNFLMSLTLSSESAETVRDGGPPRILFVWPKMVSMTCVIGSLKITHEKFSKDGRSSIFRAVVDLEEVRDFRLTSENVRVQGTFRPSAQAIEWQNVEQLVRAL